MSHQFALQQEDSTPKTHTHTHTHIDGVKHILDNAGAEKTQRRQGHVEVLPTYQPAVALWKDFQSSKRLLTLPCMFMSLKI